MTITLRPATPADAPFLEGLFVQVHRDDFAPLGLDPAKVHSLLAMQARAQRQGYQRDHPGAEDRLILRPDAAGPGGHTPVGRILTDRTPDAIHLVDIALLPGARNAGIGTMLLTQLLQEADALKLPVHLSVNRGNRALSLYRRLGFRAAGQHGQQVQLAMQYTPGAMARTQASQLAQPHPLQPHPTHLQPAHPANAWLPLLEHTFHIAPQGPALRLARVDPFPTGHAFSLLFHGPAGMPLPQGIYSLSPPARPNAAPVMLFLVPLGPFAAAQPGSAEGQLYEAVFN